MQNIAQSYASIWIFHFTVCRLLINFSRRGGLQHNNTKKNAYQPSQDIFFSFLTELIATSHCMNNKSSLHHERHVQALTMSDNTGIEYIDKHLRINSKVKLEIALGKFFSFTFYAYLAHTRSWIIDRKNNEWLLSIE